jgi:olefin beta-lactone synthetase
VRELICGGGPASRKLCRRLIQTFPEARRTIIYGSTEAEPIASTTMETFVSTPGEGYLVGEIAAIATVELVELPVETPNLDEAGLEPFRVGPGEVGEIVVSGPHVLRRYIDDPVATSQTKMTDKDGVVWHRTGDLARFDESGKLWLMGRVGDVVQVGSRTLYPYAVEVEIDSIAGVERAALITHRLAPDGELVVQVRGDEGDAVMAVKRRLDELDLARIPVAVVQKLPVDSRHNSKVNRKELRRMREEEE